MNSRTLDAETRDTRSGQLTLAASSRVPALTVLWHPQPRRVGEAAILVDVAYGSGAELSRGAPGFGVLRTAPVEPLADTSVSRSPIVIRRSEAGFELICKEPAKLSVDGQPLRGALQLSEAVVAAGVVLELSSDVALVLHFFTPRASELPLPGWVGNSDALYRVREQVTNVAAHPVNVLICGESGTGKELVAQALHQCSPRRQRPFVAVNMGSLGSTMAASALFGHKKGAFTGATSDQPGCFDTANGGTLFLDEIGATPAEVQPLLLRALEAGEIQSLGAGKPHRVDVRVVAATDADLNLAVSNQRFPLALLHRLRGYEVQLPPLRQRREDLGALLRHYLEEELGRQGRSSLLDAGPSVVPWLRAAQVAQLGRYAFPGNVRELRNLARRLAIDWGLQQQVPADGMQRLLQLEAHARPHAASTSWVAIGSPEPSATVARAPAPSVPATRSGSRPAEPSRDELLAALEASDWSPDRAAERLQLSRTTVYAWMRRLGLNIARELGAEQLRDELLRHDGDAAAAARALQVSERALRLRISALDDAHLERLLRAR